MANYIGSAKEVDHYIGNNLVVAKYIGENKYFDAYSEIEGNLPLAFKARVAHALTDYRIYGTESGAGVQTVNLFDYVSYFASVATYSQYFSCANIQLSPNTTYTLSTNFHSGTSGPSSQYRETPFIVCNTVDDPSTLTGGFGDDGSVSVTTTGDGIIELYVRISRGNNPKELCDLPTLSDFENGKWVMIVEGSTAPTSYIPYGYQIPISLTDGTITSNYDLFIGDSKLYEDEYLDFVEQKIYKTIALMTHDDKTFTTSDNNRFCVRRSNNG